MANRLVFVHGFQYDPREPGPDHPEHTTYPLWRAMLEDRGDKTLPFVWFSNPSRMDAWKHRRWNRYRWAWDLAEEAGRRLRNTLSSSEPVDIVCHSLGSRVVMQALRLGLRADKVLILNGAEYSSTGEAVARMPGVTRFYNVVVREDDVLNKLARFAPGWGGKFMGNCGAFSHLPNWQDLRLGNSLLLETWAWEHNLAVPEGDNPRRVSDHWYSFKNEENWPLYRAVFNGEWDEWLREDAPS